MNTPRLIKMMLLAIAILVSNSIDIKAQNQLPDSSLEELIKAVTKGNKAMETLAENADSSQKAKATELTNLQVFVVFMTPGLFIFFFLLVAFYLSRGGFKLSSALSENVKVEIPNPDETAKKDKPVITIDKPISSSSRLIAFMSGVSAITIAISTVTFYFFCVMSGRTIPEMKNLWEVVFGLGIGVVPYTANRFFAKSS